MRYLPRPPVTLHPHTRNAPVLVRIMRARERENQARVMRAPVRASWNRASRRDRVRVMEWGLS